MSSRFNETVLTTLQAFISNLLLSKCTSHTCKPASLASDNHNGNGFSPPLPLCKAHVVRHITIATAQAFGLFVLQVAGGRFVVGEPFVVMVLVVVVTHRLRTAEIVRNAH
ncbi:hypothetical protein K440DRAFT_619372 [Wilcoxina mikolae CBS 423.85]|nr:hypothetical protein K440DRAFT_619372 [Wilcoxina mikolae CBS 423.85]